jgi:hypothetical protein
MNATTFEKKRTRLEHSLHVHDDGVDPDSRCAGKLGCDFPCRDRAPVPEEAERGAAHPLAIQLRPIGRPDHGRQRPPFVSQRVSEIPEDAAGRQQVILARADLDPNARNPQFNARTLVSPLFPPLFSPVFASLFVASLFPTLCPNSVTVAGFDASLLANGPNTLLLTHSLRAGLLGD